MRNAKINTVTRLSFKPFMVVSSCEMICGVGFVCGCLRVFFKNRCSKTVFALRHKLKESSFSSFAHTFPNFIGLYTNYIVPITACQVIFGIFLHKKHCRRKNLLCGGSGPKNGLYSVFFADGHHGGGIWVIRISHIGGNRLFHRTANAFAFDRAVIGHAAAANVSTQSKRLG